MTLDLNKLKELMGRAVKGPWEYKPIKEGEFKDELWGYWAKAGPSYVGAGEENKEKANCEAALIVEAINSLPELIRLTEAGQQLAEAVRGMEKRGVTVPGKREWQYAIDATDAFWETDRDRVLRAYDEAIK